MGIGPSSSMKSAKPGEKPKRALALAEAVEVAGRQHRAGRDHRAFDLARDPPHGLQRGRVRRVGLQHAQAAGDQGAGQGVRPPRAS